GGEGSRAGKRLRTLAGAGIAITSQGTRAPCLRQTTMFCRHNEGIRMPAILQRLLLLTLLAFFQPLLATEIEDEEDAAPAPISERLEQDSDAQRAEPAALATPQVFTPDTFALLGNNVAPGSFNTLSWRAEQSFASIATPVPVLVAHGAKRGPVLCLTAAVHGDEI